jgi:hypothetical protein
MALMPKIKIRDIVKDAKNKYFLFQVVYRLNYQLIIKPIIKINQIN